MDRRQIQPFKTRLEARQHELRLSLEHRKEDVRHAEPEADSVDQASSGYDKSSALQTSDRDHQLLQMVEAALVRIRDGTYGCCVACHGEIGAKRLGALPWTPYCIRCQEGFEG